MATDNSSIIHPTVFILLGIPGLEAHYIWIGFPFCFMYIIAVMGNCTLLFFIKIEPTLHQPMYFFLCMLSFVDLTLSTTTMPKMLAILWFNYGEIYFEACITQMFFIHTTAALESTILLVMSFDRYVAICHPLRYTAILTNPVICKIGLVALIRCLISTTPLNYLLLRLSFCKSNIIAHSYCEHMSVAKLACADITLNNLYGMVVALLVVLFDVILILLSYLLILRAVFRLSSRDARVKAFSTCGSHICAILAFYVPVILSTVLYRFGKNIPTPIHILLVNVYLMAPPMVNPIVYGVQMKQIRERVTKQFQRLV
ncbi:olfactory receptor 52K1-like isoform X1 [Ambystoma mexicanum]|uniref:olfactory receptor 52K1-like isoform X1 n=1 Tax=Ambystoma mexicanum TaxID=8296 RepID=UPI0037E88029